ncbi:MAG: alkaline phosphatase D family protein [Planctomycetota bacterium]
MFFGKPLRSAVSRHLAWAVVILCSWAASATAQQAVFVRGDCNRDGAFNVADPIFLTQALFPGSGSTPVTITCDDSCDANDDGLLDVADPIYSLTAQFAAGSLPPAPFPFCGADLTEDALGCSEYPRCASPALSISAGDTTTSSVILWARSPSVGTVEFSVSTDPHFSTVDAQGTANVVNPELPVKLEIAGLAAGTNHWYRAIRGDQSAQGVFRTASAPGTRGGLRFGVSGDWRGELAPYPAVRNVAERSLDFFVLHGDTIYADFPSPAVPLPQATNLDEYRTKHGEVYADNFAANPFRSLRSSTTIYATIDDHEVTNDFAGGADPASDPRFAFTTEAFINQTQLFSAGVQAFQEYNPLRDLFYGATGDPRTENRRKLYRFQRFGSDAALFVLDARSFRDEPLPPVLNPLDPTAVTNFLIASFDPSRTMLGAAQLAELLNDLALAQAEGITWKFILVPEPIQNLGVIAAQDRYDGYAAERNFLLSSIAGNIDNVVFIAADFHGSLVNDLAFQTSPLDPPVMTTAFEISTGSVAFDAPFGPTVVEIAAAAGLVTPDQLAFYNSLPTMDARDSFVQTLVNGQLAVFGISPLGFSGSLVNFTLELGSFFRGHAFGWTEFDIDADTSALSVTIYGLDAYTEAEIVSDPTVLDRQPEVLTRFVVTPQ